MSCNKLGLIAAISLAMIGLAFSFELKDCSKGHTEADLISFDIDTCPDKSAKRCVFYIGKNATSTINLRPTVAFQQANIKIGAIVAFKYVPIAFPGPKDACGNYGISCPPTVGQNQTIKFSLPVDKTLYPLKAKVRFELDDQNSDKILCYQFPVELKKA